MRKIPELFRDKMECCGCGACAAICIRHAIKMVEDKEGFFYPIIDQRNCIKCYQCLQVCPFSSD